MLISYCLPCHKRIEDLLASMPSVVIAANQSPPVEIVVIDYGNSEPLAPLLETFRAQLFPGNSLVVKEYRKRDYYHMAHARNLSIRAATGDFIAISSSDIQPFPHYFANIRERLIETGATYLRSQTEGFIGLIVCDRNEMIAMGGYDERIEFYGSEDKDFLHRLVRRGLKMGLYDLDAIIGMIRTPDLLKSSGYRLPLTKKEMSALGHAILKENDARQLIIANEGIIWGED